MCNYLSALDDIPWVFGHGVRERRPTGRSRAPLWLPFSGHHQPPHQQTDRDELHVPGCRRRRLQLGPHISIDSTFHAPINHPKATEAAPESKTDVADGCR